MWDSALSSGRSTSLGALLRWLTPRARSTDPPGQVSDNEGQFRERVGEPRDGRYVGAQTVEAPAEVLHQGMPGDDDPGGAISLQPAHRAESRFQASVVGLETVVRVDRGAVEGRRQHVIEDAGVGPVPVSGDLNRLPSGASDGPSEKPANRVRVPARRQKHVDDLAELVDCSEQVPPGPSYLQVGLIDVPAIPDDVPTGPGCLGELGCEPLHPPVHRHVVNHDPALGEEFLDVSVGQGEPQVPADRQTDDLWWEPIPSEG